MSNYLGAKIANYKHYANPANPEQSDWWLVFFKTALKAVIDTDSGESLDSMLNRQRNSLTGHLSDTNIHVTPDWVDGVSALLAELVAFSQSDIISPEDRRRWNQAAEDAARALLLGYENAGSIIGLTGRVLQMEDSLFNEITANPFTISFDNLDGLNVIRGIWNPTFQRIEC